MRMKDYLLIILKHGWLIALGGVLGLGIALVAIWLAGSIPVYMATATVIVGGDVEAVQSNLLYSDLGPQFLGTYVDLATRGPVMQAVIEELGLGITPEMLAGMVDAMIVENTQLIEIAVRNPDPNAAASIANSVARQLVSSSDIRLRDFVILVEEAKVPSRSSLAWLPIPIIGGMLGLTVTGGWVFLAEFLRDPVYSAEDIVQRTGLPVLAIVRPKQTGLRGRLRRTPSWRNVNEAVWWPLVQACRRRQGDLEIPPESNRGGIRILVTTPTDSLDGKIVATNLAVAWSKTGERVLLVDAEADCPTLHEWFELPPRPGLGDLLSEELDDSHPEEAIQATEFPGLRLLAGGSTSGDLSGDRHPHLIKPLMERLADYADVIVLNGPPIATTESGAVLARQAHGVLLVLQAGETKMTDVIDANYALTLLNAELWGAILTEGIG